MVMVMSYLPAANRTVNSLAYTFGWPLPLGDIVFGHWPEKQLVRLEEQCQGLEYECLSRDIRAPDGSHQAVHQALLALPLQLIFAWINLNSHPYFFARKARLLKDKIVRTHVFAKVH